MNWLLEVVVSAYQFTSLPIDQFTLLPLVYHFPSCQYNVAMITQDDLAIYKKKLEEEKARLMKEVGEEEKSPSFGEEGNVDIEAGADEAEEFSNQLAISQTLKDRVGEINDALDRMETGTYGDCTSCGKPIPKEVLDLAPESALCMDCKQKGNE